MQGNDTPHFTQSRVGFDVSRGHLEIAARGPAGEDGFDVSNTGAGLRMAVRRLSALGVRRVAMEATGRPYLRAWQQFDAAGFETVVLNPERPHAALDGQPPNVIFHVGTKTIQPDQEMRKVA